MSEDDDVQAQLLADLVRNDPWRANYEKGVDPWPESSGQQARAAVNRGPVRLTLRLPRHLYEQAKRAARRDGMSLNTFLVGSIAKEIGDELGYGRARGT